MTAPAPRSVRLFVPRRPTAPADLSALPALRRLLSRARVSWSAEPGLYPKLLRAFGVHRQGDWPFAAFSWLGDEGTRDAAYRLRADPVHLRADRDALVLTDAREFPLAAHEAAQLVDALNAHFERDGLRFAAPVPSRWYVTVADTPEIATQPLDLALGRNVDALLPNGADALVWHRYFNEIQMLFHAHPVNATREEAGQPAINSVWFWGGGVLPGQTLAPPSALWADDPVARGLAIAAGAQPLRTPANFPAWLAQSASGKHAIWLDASESRRGRLENDWFAPLLEALRARMIARASLALGDAAGVLCFELTPADLWKFWRSAALPGLS